MTLIDNTKKKSAMQQTRLLSSTCTSIFLGLKNLFEILNPSSFHLMKKL
jgi:hypothetical protein